MSSLRKFIRPNRDDLIRTYVKFLAFGTFLLANEIGSATLELASIENDGADRWLTWLLRVAGLLVWVRVQSFDDVDEFNDVNRPISRARTFFYNCLLVASVMWLCLVVDVLSVSAKEKIFLVTTPFILLIGGPYVIMSWRQKRLAQDH